MSKLRYTARDYVFIRESFFDVSWLAHPSVVSDDPLYIMHDGIACVLVKVDIGDSRKFQRITKLLDTDVFIVTRQVASQTVSANAATGYLYSRNPIMSVADA